MSSNAITAVQTRSPFRLRCAVSARIQAPPETVWELLTRADGMVRWNSTLTNIEGEIQLGGTVKMRVPEAPGQTFTIKVVRFVPNKEMEWRQGTPVIFLGVRTYQVTPTPEGTAADFQMTETFAGILLPVLARRLPDFGPIFERYAADLKATAEQ
jgi:uncharacterized protein YndB with AHSA1/START domain